MGLILQYRLALPQQGLTLSNNVYRGEYILDAEITAEMVCGFPGSVFKAKIWNLPEKEVKKLNTALGNGPLPIQIDLGYFEFPFAPLMTGVVKKVEAAVEEGKLVTTLTGGESATQALADSRAQQALPSGLSAAEVVRRLLASLPAGSVPVIGSEIGPEVTQTLQEGIRQGSLLSMLDEAARLLNAEMFVMDGKIWIGRPVERRDYLPPPKLAPDDNLAGFEPFQRDLPEEIKAYHLKPLPATQVQGFRFKIAGDPKLRPGHPVVPMVDDYGPASGLRFRTVSLKHVFSFSSGYVCEGMALKYRPNDDNTRRESGAEPRLCAADIARLFTGRIDSAISQRPFVEMGKVKEHTPAAGGGTAPHRASLYYGQEVGREITATEPQPSIRAEVRQDEEQIFRGKPLLSPFAWHKCGLVVPVYPGMKAVLLHNLGRAEDPVVAGYVWAERPAIEPPSAQRGDWWLCLPSDYDGSAPPGASTKASNDLTASNGKRVIEAKGLKITIGASNQRPVGERPTEGGDDELLIEHSSGTFIKISSDGKISIKASEVSIEGDVRIQGNLDIQ